MIFTELRFLVFFAIVFGVFQSLSHRPAQKLWLLLMSYAFYAAWDWRFLSLIVISTLVDYVVGLRLAVENRERRRRLWLTASIVTNLGMLGIFKYLGFFTDTAVEFLGFLGFAASRSTLEVVLPVGISFFTFQTMSYSIDAYRRQLEPTRSLLDLSLFVAFFPQLVAGPIVRARSFLPQLDRARPMTRIASRPLLALFLLGFVKKACISDNVATVADPYFADPTAYSAGAAWLAILLYAVQIYCDFSGYSDMAIAAAGLLGFDLGANFRRPYLALSPQDFWRRWHISLSTWLRDYLYVPLGGNRGGRAATARNIMITMILGGLWHGAAWRFIVWGALHGLALVGHRAVFGESQWKPGLVARVAGALATFWFVATCWIFFRATDLDSAMTALGSWVLFRSPGDGAFDPAWWILPGALALVQVAAEKWPRPYERLPSWAFAVGYGVAVALALLFVRFEARPFIYFQF